MKLQVFFKSICNNVKNMTLRQKVKYNKINGEKFFRFVDNFS